MSDLSEREKGVNWELPMRQSSGDDFLGLNPTGKPVPQVGKPIGVPSTVPEIDALYKVQDNILRSLQSLHDLEDRNPDMHWSGLDHHLTNTYKTLNRWLREHG